MLPPCVSSRISHLAHTPTQLTAMISTQRATRCTSVRRHTRGCGTGSPCHHAHAPGRSRPAWANNVVTMNPACGILKQKTHIRPREPCVRVRTSVCERRLKENVKGRVSTWRVEETLPPAHPRLPKCCGALRVRRRQVRKRRSPTITSLSDCPCTARTT